MLSENYKIVPVLSDQDLNGAATMAGDSINMSAYHEATFIVGLQTLGGANCEFGVYSGVTDGACTTFVPFRYAYGTAATGSASSDILAAWTKATALVAIAHASKDNFMLIVEVDAAEMTAGHKWLTFRFEDTPTGSTGNAQVHAILKPRFPAGLSVTALT
jgi:hypothetical protein